MRITARIDRPLGSAHPKHPDLIYRVNYGEVVGVPAPDGDWQDAYVLGVDVPVEAFTGRRIAVIHRRDDIETKWVLAPDGMVFTEDEIMGAVHFQEQYFDSYCVMEEVGGIAIVRADSSNEEETIRIRLDCLRTVNHLPRSHVFPTEFVDQTCDFLRHADQTTLLACDGDITIGCATLCYKRCIPTPGHPTGRRAHLMNVYVAEGYRRQGVAKQLILALHAEAEARGVTEITLDATDLGRKLYEVLGYRASDECMYFDIGRSQA
ncbi:MAG: GNAT family N-acetyltransferase [Clostridia bacterium]|nr:GNAT family N-acetyltransferase [Clostridia bacterium]